MNDLSNRVTVDLHMLKSPRFPQGGRGLELELAGEGKVPDLLRALELDPGLEVLVVADGRVLLKGETIPAKAKLSVFPPMEGG